MLPLFLSKNHEHLQKKVYSSSWRFLMAKAKNESDDFTSDLIKSLNKEHGTRVAYNLEQDESPTHVKRWISTGSKQLDYIVSNRRNGGLPEGRIVEIFGPPSIGKSHIAIQIARTTQRMGGIVVYIDTENATSVENLKVLENIDVGLTVEVGSTEIKIRDLLRLSEGSVIELDRLAGDPLDILVNGTMIAKGEVVMVGERFGIRFSEIVDPAKRVESL